MADKKKKQGFKFGPFEQAIAVLLIMGFAANPSSVTYNPFQTGVDGISGSLNGLPLLSPPLVMLIGIAYLGYYFLSIQSAARDRLKTLDKVSSSSSSKSSQSSSSSSSGSGAGKPLSSSDIRSKGGMPSSSPSGSGNPAPKQVSGKTSLDTRKDPSSSAFKKNYFLTMQGPGRPALVPFQDGLRPAKGKPEGTMWWDNVPKDSADLMAPPVDPSKTKEMTKNPWITEIVRKDIELLKMKKRQKEEEERYEKVASFLQTILGFLLCLVDMRLGVLSLIFFLWRHFTLQAERDTNEEADALDNEKKELEAKIKVASQTASSSHQSTVQDMMAKLKRL